MKNRFAVAMMIISLILSLTACGGKDTAGGLASGQETGNTAESTDQGNVEGDSSETVTESSGDTAAGTSNEGALAEAEDMYTAFLSEKATVTAADDYNVVGYSEGKDEVRELEPGVAYDLKGLVSRSIKMAQRSVGDAFGLNIELSGVSYCMLSCGDDEVPMMALQVDFVYPQFNRIYFLKQTGDSLKITDRIAGGEGYYEALLNSHGVIAKGGYESLFEEFHVLNEDGKVCFLWEKGTYYDLGEDYYDAGHGPVSIFKAAHDHTDEIKAHYGDTPAVGDEWLLYTYSDIVYADRDDEAKYVESLLYTSDPAADAEPVIEAIFKDAGVAPSTDKEIEAFKAKRYAEAGISKELSAYDETDITWKDVSCDSLEEIKSYGADPVFVSTVEELVAAVHDYANIVLAPGTYNVTGYINEHADEIAYYNSGDQEQNNTPGVLYDGWGEGDVEMNIYGITGLTIRSKDPEHPAEIVSEPRYWNVLSFRRCSMLTLKNLIMGHTPEQGVCSGDVVGLYNCDATNVSGCDLYGCGAYGMKLSESQGTYVADTVIHDCSYGVIETHNDHGVTFTDCTFRDCREYTMFDITGNGYNSFIRCTFKNLNGDMLQLDDNSTVSFLNCMMDNAAWQKVNAYTENKNPGTVYIR
ncbi:MAG: right-handed parallel beta-helix repeat-containing protein [Eubacteriales bacterium]|nr:right-handed parallel beta-helix repeat-containing protein [Eubacteriales bacterium]